MDSINALFTAVASVTGGRNGHAEAEDHLVSVNLSVPKAMGGPGKPGATTPEHLFAAGYAACFGGALRGGAEEEERQKRNRHLQRFDRTARSGGIRNSGEASREGCEPAPGRVVFSRS